MGIKRIVDVSFWTDGKVDDFSPEDKYFMLYLLTNPFSKQLGIYEISIKQAAFQMGYSTDVFNVLLERFEKKYNIIRYSKETNEIAILNFLRHSVMKGGKPVEDCIKRDMAMVKNKKLIDFVFSRLIGRDDLNETVKKLVDGYANDNDIQNDNDNDNDNDRTVDESWYESSHESRATPKNDYQQIVDLYNSICTSFPSVRSLSDARRKAIKARLNTYTVEDFKQCFENAEASSFLKGGNDSNWTATFDWLIKDTNMAKVLDGNYADKPGKGDWKPSLGNSFDTDDFFNAALERSMRETNKPRSALERVASSRMEAKSEAKTAADDPELKRKAEALINELQNA